MYDWNKDVHIIHGHKYNVHYLNKHLEMAAVLEAQEFEGVSFTVLDKELEPGDSYLAQRNTGVKLLTVKKNVKDLAFIVPVEMSYSYDTGECIPIQLNI